MRSLIAALRNLVLPAGATSGRRIILSGDDGTIEVYDSAGNLRIRIGEQDVVYTGAVPIEFFTSQTSEQFPGLLFGRALGLGSSPTRQVQQILQTAILNASRSGIDLRSDSFDGTVLGTIDLFAEGDATFNGNSFVRRLLDLATISANQTGITAEADITGLSVTWNANTNCIYRLESDARGCTSATATDRYRVAITNASNNHVGSEYDGQVQVANVVQGGAHCAAFVGPGLSGSVTYKVRCARLAGASTVTYAGAPGGGSGGAYLSVETMGVS